MTFKKTVNLIKVTTLVGLITLSLVEVGLRIFDPVGIKYFFENDRYFAQLVPNEKYAYIHPANSSETFQGVQLRTNSWGLRGPEFSRERPADSKRILVLGDSVVLGWGVPENEIFPSLLEVRLGRENIRAEVISAAVSSWNTRNQFEYLRDVGVTLDPDVLVMVIVPNDVIPKDSGITAIPTEQLFPEPQQSGSDTADFKDHLWLLWERLGKHSYAVKYVQYFLKIKYRQQAFQGLDGDSPSWLDARLALNGIVAICEKMGIQPVFVLYGSDETVQSNNSLRLYRDFLEGNGLAFLTIPEEIFLDARYRISLADSHANAEGQVLISDTIYPQLQQTVLSLAEN